MNTIRHSPKAPRTPTQNKRHCFLSTLTYRTWRISSHREKHSSLTHRSARHQNREMRTRSRSMSMLRLSWIRPCTIPRSLNRWLSGRRSRKLRTRCSTRHLRPSITAFWQIQGVHQVIWPRNSSNHQFVIIQSDLSLMAKIGAERKHNHIPQSWLTPTATAKLSNYCKPVAIRRKSRSSRKERRSAGRPGMPWAR